MLPHMMLLQIADLRVGVSTEVAFARLEPVVRPEMVLEVAALREYLGAAIHLAIESWDVSSLFHIINFLDLEPIRRITSECLRLIRNIGPSYRIQTWLLLLTPWALWFSRRASLW